MPITVTPTLSTKTGYVEDIRDQVATLIRFIIMNPGRTSEIWEEDMLSFRTLSARYEGSREQFASRLGTLIENKCGRMFKDYVFTSNFSVEDYEEGTSDGRYTIMFDLSMMKTGQESATSMPALISGAVTVDTDSNEIFLTYKQSMDTFEL